MVGSHSFRAHVVGQGSGDSRAFARACRGLFDVVSLLWQGRIPPVVAHYRGTTYSDVVEKTNDLVLNRAGNNEWTVLRVY